MTTPWTIGTVDAPPTGTAVHLMLQGRTRGLVGRGTVRSAPYLAADPDRPGALSTHILVEWDRLALVQERIEPAALDKYVPTIAWSELYGNVHALTQAQARALDQAWLAADRPPWHGPAGLVEAVGGVVGHLLHLTHLGPGPMVAGLLRPLAAGHQDPDVPAA